MARKYSKKASSSVERAMKKRNAGTLKSGRSGRTVKSRKQAIAIGLSEARAAGLLVAFDDVAGLGVDHLLLQPMAGFLVDHVKAGFVHGSRSRIEQYRA